MKTRRHHNNTGLTGIKNGQTQKSADFWHTKYVVHKDSYTNETVEEIIEKCRQAYFKYGCDKFKNFEEAQ
jgi:hypothetical protein